LYINESFNKEIANARYNLLSRKKHSPVIVRPVTLKVRDQETPAGLTDKDREALLAEMPFHWVYSPESDAEVEENLNP